MNSLLVVLTIIVCNGASGLNSNGGNLCVEAYRSDPIALSDCNRAKTGPQIQQLIQQLIIQHPEWKKPGMQQPRATCMEHVERQ